MTLHVPKDDVALANTPELSHAGEPGGMQVVKFKESKPLPSYLVALAVGHFDIVDAGKVGKTPLRIITPHGKAANAKYAAEAIPQLLKLLENYLGIPYPYEKLDSIAMPISNFAMENAGLITYGETTLLAKPEEDSINRQRGCAIVTAHEMAHQWWDQQVIGANMEGATLLSETLAQYSALMVMEREYGRDAMRNASSLAKKPAIRTTPRPASTSSLFSMPVPACVSLA